MRLLERQVVVRLFERAGKLLEILGGRLGAGLGATLGRRARGTRRRWRTVVGVAAATAEQDQLAHADLRDVARLALFILILAILDLALDEHLLPFLAVALDDVGQAAAV